MKKLRSLFGNDGDKNEKYWCKRLYKEDYFGKTGRKPVIYIKLKSYTSKNLVRYKNS